MAYEFDKNPGSEKRGMACTRGQTFIGPIVSCSAHLSSKSTSDAEIQSNEYSFVAAVDSVAGADFRVLSGDFNLEPVQRPPVWTQSYGRITTGDTWNAYTPDRVIDYIHVVKPNLVHQLSNSGRMCEPMRSDHCFIHGAYD